MTKTIDYFIGKLPKDIQQEIFQFIIPHSNAISFYKYTTYCHNYSVSNKYDVAFLNNSKTPIKNKNNEYLCRIVKKNGKHRYYVTNERETRYCWNCDSATQQCKSRLCEGDYEYNYDFTNKYAGKNIEKALLELLLTEKN